MIDTRSVFLARIALILLLLPALLAAGRPPAGRQSPIDPPPLPASDRPAPLFVENAGQFAGGARFQARLDGHVLWLAGDAIWLTLLDRPVDPSAASPLGRGQGAHVKLTFPGSNPHPRLEPFGRQEARLSFFTGSDPAAWRTAVAAWAGVRYVELYPGVDLEITGAGGRVVPRLVLRPGADLAAVRLRVDGAGAVALDGDLLRITTPGGGAAAGFPLLSVAGVTARPTVTSPGPAAFEVDAPFTGADPDAGAVSPAVDSPADLLYGTFLGGGQSDHAYGLAVDGAGSIYVTGYTESFHFPTTPGAFDTTRSGEADVFVARLSAGGSSLDYATFIGSSDREWGRAIAVDGAGSAYITGWTWASSFPTTPGAFDRSFSGPGDAFVLKLSADGTALAYSTLLGGSVTDGGYDLAVDDTGAAYVTGSTSSSDFPVTPGAFDLERSTYYDAFVAKLNPDGTALEYATYLGGAHSGDTLADNIGHSIVVDAGGAAYVAGWTGTTDFPTTPGAFDTTYNGWNDGFVARLSAGGSDLEYGTYLGGSQNDLIRALAVGPDGAIYVAGDTYSSDLPTTPAAFDTSYNGSGDAFVVKLNAAGSALAYSTFLGGSGQEVADIGPEPGLAIAVGTGGQAYVAGGTLSTDFPAACRAVGTTGQGAFVARLDASGSRLLDSTILGDATTRAWRILLAEGPSAWVAGRTASAAFPTSPGAFDTTYNGSGDAFLVKLSLAGNCVYLPLAWRNQ